MLMIGPLRGWPARAGGQLSGESGTGVWVTARQGREGGRGGPAGRAAVTRPSRPGPTGPAGGYPLPLGVQPVRGHDLTDRPAVARFLRRPGWQFALTAPNHLLFWLVIVNGLVGVADPGRSFATTVTWNVWFCLVFVLILTTGRGWCAVCPFGGAAEAVQRRALWGRGRPIGLGLAFPPALSQLGYLLPVAALLLLTFIEERFTIADGGAPVLTSYLILGIMLIAIGSFLVFERRSFCRYLCPLSALIGILGAVAPVAGFRTRDHRACTACTTRDCLRGTQTASGCPWYAWPGSAESNLSCGLCGECYHACPTDQVGLYLSPPLESVVRPGRRRADVGWGVAILAGLVLFEQVHATATYRRLEGWLNGITHLTGSPNPVSFFGFILGVTLLAALPALAVAVVLDRRSGIPTGRPRRRAWVAPAGTGHPNAEAGPDGLFVNRRSTFRSIFLPLMYAGIPLVGADYLAVQLPRFLNGAAAAVPALGRAIGLAVPPGSSLTQLRLLGPDGIAAAQVTVLAVGLLASLYAAWTIAGQEVTVTGRATLLARLGMGALITVLGLLAIALLLTAWYAGQQALLRPGTGMWVS